MKTAQRIATFRATTASTFQILDERRFRRRTSERSGVPNGEEDDVEDLVAERRSELKEIKPKPVGDSIIDFVRIRFLPCVLIVAMLHLSETFVERIGIVGHFSLVMSVVKAVRWRRSFALTRADQR